jgi:hypothetical protein
MSMDTFLAAGSTLACLTGVFVAIRVFSGLKFSGRLFADDCKRCTSAVDTWNMTTDKVIRYLDRCGDFTRGHDGNVL